MPTYFEPRTLEILLVGLGNVAIGYDLKSNVNYPKTHLISLLKYADIEGVVLNITAVEPNSVRAAEAKVRIPQLYIVKNLIDISKYKKFDIAINCVPISESIGVTKFMLDQFEISLLVLEKPGALNSSQGLILNRLMLEHGNSFIAYPRRALHSSTQLKQAIESYPENSWQVSIKFSGSKSNILCHFVDLVAFVFEDYQKIGPRSPYVSTYVQTADINNNDHEVLIEGPIKILYSGGGSSIIIQESQDIVKEINAQIEIQSQIYFSVRSYMNYFLKGEKMNFPMQIGEEVLSILGGVTP